MSVLFCRIGDSDTEWVALWGGIYASAAIALVALVLFPAALTVHSRRALMAMTIGCGIFQVGHFTEHTGQMVGLSTVGGLTLTWWAQQIVYGFAWIARAPDPHVGLELMHFFGDLIYLSGVIAWWRIDRGRLATGALCIQSAHQIEHLYLITTILVGGRAVGLTAVGPVSMRIIIHFTLNFGGSILWACSLWKAYRCSPTPTRSYGSPRRWHGRWSTSGS